MTCMRERCQNPCFTSNPCSSSQQCVVTDSRSSYRSVACVCPEGTIAGYGGTCDSGKKLHISFDLINVTTLSYHHVVDAKPQCVTDSDCDVDKECYQGSCRFACSQVSCGQNAICRPQFHKGVCECLSGFKGNPTIACTKGMFL